MQLPPEGRLHGAAGTCKSRPHGANGDLEPLGDGAVIEPGLLVEGQGLALLARQRVDASRQLLAGFVGDGDVQGIVATLVQLAVRRCDVFVFAAAGGGSSQVQAAVDDRASQPLGQVRWWARLPPECDQAFLNGIVGEVIAAEQAPRDGSQSREVCGELGAGGGVQVAGRTAGGARHRRRTYAQTADGYRELLASSLCPVCWNYLPASGTLSACMSMLELVW